MTASLPDRVAICEVAPRDGLQNEAVPVSTADKLRLIASLVDAGAKRIEATSFVHPGRVPQMADAEQVMAGVPRGRGVRWSGLALNRRGVERAIAAGCDEVTFVVAASETFSARNQGQSVAEGRAGWAEAAALIQTAGRIATLTIATAFGCPFEGDVEPAIVRDIAADAARAGAAELGLADTVGVATPAQVGALFAQVASAAPGVTLRGHFHNTRNTGYANAYAALLAGATVLDSSAGGIGGCPFAPRATGNIATEDLLFMLDGMGIATGLDRARIASIDPWLATLLGHPVAALLGKTDPWPPARRPVPADPPSSHSTHLDGDQIMKTLTKTIGLTALLALGVATGALAQAGGAGGAAGGGVGGGTAASGTVGGGAAAGNAAGTTNTHVGNPDSAGRLLHGGHAESGVGPGASGAPGATKSGKGTGADPTAAGMAGTGH